MALFFPKWINLLFLSFIFHGSIKKDTEIKNSKHPFYISVTEINHNNKENTLEVSCKMFADDFEQILQKNYHKQLDISSEKDKALLEKLIPDYMTKHLSVVVDGKITDLVYVGFEKEKESVYCYIQCAKIITPKKINITNSILHDFNDTQINIIHVTVNGKRQSTKLDFPHTEASFVF